MKEQTGSTYQPASNTIKALAVAPSKDGKTTTLIAQILGLMPNQKHGGVISSPSNLHVVITDTAALDKLKDFLVKHCGASDEALQFKVYNMEEDYTKAFSIEYDSASFFYNTFIATIKKIDERCRQKPNEVHAVIFSSITTIARAILRGIRGGVKESKDDSRVLAKQSMSIPKWSMLQDQLNEVQSLGHMIPAHIFWEGHLGTKLDNEDKDSQGKATEYDTISIPGSVGESWAANVSHPLKIVRQQGQQYPNTRIDKSYFDTQPNLRMAGMGRGATTHLNKQETDLTELITKLGMKVGNWKQSEVEAEE